MATFALLYLLASLVPAWLAHRTGRDFALWWLYGFLLLIVALPHALLLAPDETRLDERLGRRGYRHCPCCAEPIRMAVTVCRACGRDVPTLAATAGPPLTDTDRLFRQRAGIP